MIIFIILSILIALGLAGFISMGLSSLNIKATIRVKLYFWGVLISGIIGFTVAKVYMIWSVFFLKEHVGVPDMWYSEPLWLRINDLIIRHPFVFQNVIVMIFIFLGVFFTRSFFDPGTVNNKNISSDTHEREENL